MPELLTTVFFLVNAYGDPRIGHSLAASFGGDTGSAVFNSIVIPIFVIAAVLVKGGKFELTKKVILRDGLFLIGAELVLLVLLSSDTITWVHGLIFTLYYLVYLGYVLYTMPKGETVTKSDEELIEDVSDMNRYEKFLFKSTTNITSRAVVLLIGSMLALAALCDGLVIGAEGIASVLGISTLVVALVVVAAASSVPDLIISVKDAKKGNYNDSLSNVLGSNIFDITISAGLPLMLFLLITGTTIDFTEAGPTLLDIRIGLLIITAIVVGIMYFFKLDWKVVIVLGVLYALFIGYALYTANGGTPLVPEFVLHGLKDLSNSIL